MKDRISDAASGMVVGAVLMFAGGVATDLLNGGEVWQTYSAVDKAAVGFLISFGVFVAAWMGRDWAKDAKNKKSGEEE